MHIFKGNSKADIVKKYNKHKKVRKKLSKFNKPCQNIVLEVVRHIKICKIRFLSSRSFPLNEKDFSSINKVDNSLWYLS
jgi:hypothetical protein